MTLWKWSKTAASNTVADSTVNLRENQAPSTLNNASRAMMAAVAKYSDDQSGTITTGGTGTAYTATTNQVLNPLTNGFYLTFVAHATSTANPTLSVDGLTAKPLRYASGRAIPDGGLVAGAIYSATYFSASQEWIVHHFFEDVGTPIGCSVEYWGTTSPSSNLVFPFGQAISRTDYPVCFERLGTIHGVGDGSTTFNLPDCRGRVSAGKDDMGGTSANRLTNQTGGLNGDTLGAVGGLETHALTEAQVGPHAHGPGSLSGPATVTSTVSNIQQNTTGTTPPSGGASPVPISNGGAVASTGSATMNSGATASAGSGSGHNNVQPTIICNKLIRIL